MVDNDLVLEKWKKYPKQIDLFTYLKKTCLKKMIVRSNYDIEYSWEELVLKYNYPASQNKYGNTCLLNKIIETSPNEKIIYYSLSNSLLPEEPLNDPSKVSFLAPKLMMTYENIIKTNGDYLMKFPQNEYLGITDKETHPSKETHLKFSEYLYDEIITNPKWNF